MASVQGQSSSPAAAKSPASAPAPATAAGNKAADFSKTHATPAHAGQQQRATGSNDLKAAQHGTATQNAPFVNEGVATGAASYPKFVPPKAATSQMSDAEQKQFQQTMSDRIKANQQAPESPAEAAERQKLLKALAEKHAQDTLNSIEK